MLKTLSLYDKGVAFLSVQSWILPTLARLLFAGVLALYFVNSGLTKVDSSAAGLWTPSVGAYAQIFPKALETAGYSPQNLTLFHHVLVYAGIISEFMLPALIVLGLFTRVAAFGMIGFVALQSLTDVYGHGQIAALGRWFDRFPELGHSGSTGILGLYPADACA